MCIFPNSRIFRLQSTVLLRCWQHRRPTEQNRDRLKSLRRKSKSDLDWKSLSIDPFPSLMVFWPRSKLIQKFARAVALTMTRPSPRISASWFEASQIHLDGPEEIDVLVKAKNACLFGANIGPFWIFRKTQRGYELVLNVSALGVELLPSRTSGHKDVSAGAVAGGKSVIVFYKFDGHRYQESGNKVEATE